MVAVASELPTTGYALEVDGRLKTEFETKERAWTCDLAAINGSIGNAQRTTAIGAKRTSRKSPNSTKYHLRTKGPCSNQSNRPISSDGGPSEDRRPVWECLPFAPSTGGTETANSGVTGASYHHGTKAPPAVSASTCFASRLSMGPGLWSYSSPGPRPCLPSPRPPRRSNPRQNRSSNRSLWRKRRDRPATRSRRLK